MTLDPRRLLVLDAVHSTGSVQAAATRLHLTASAVSQHLSRLEAETGLALVDRSRLGGGRSISLTAAGQLLAQHARVVADALAEGERALAALQGDVAGPVVVGAFPTAVRHLVAPAVTRLARSHPALHPRVVEVSEPGALHDLAAGRLDVAVLERDGDAAERSLPGMSERPLLRDPYRVVVPATWPDVDDQDVLSGPWVGGPDGSAARAALERLAAAAGAARPQVVHQCLEFPAALALVAAGLGSALVPDLALGQLPHEGVRVHQGALDAGARVLTLAHRTGRHEPTRAAGVVMAELVRQAAGGSA